MDRILPILTRIMDEKTAGYLQEEPYEVFCTLVNEGADQAKARLVLISLLAGAPELEQKMEMDELSACLQRNCWLQKEAADELAVLYHDLNAPIRDPAETECHDAGFEEFCSRVWEFHWDGIAQWNNGHVCFDCCCSLKADIRVIRRELARDAALEAMKNPAPLSAEAFFAFFAGQLQDRLQEDLDLYTGGDDLQGPYMPDYVPDVEQVLEEICAERGLQYSGFECEATQGGYEEATPRRGR